jgi:hypothetical protein
MMGLPAISSPRAGVVWLELGADDGGEIDEESRCNSLSYQPKILTRVPAAWVRPESNTQDAGRR